MVAVTQGDREAVTALLNPMTHGEMRADILSGERDYSRDVQAQARARLASPQPDAQQGEGRGIRINGEPATPEDVLAIGRQLDAEDGGYPTPSSPALDAATIERCAQVAEDYPSPLDRPDYIDVVRGIAGAIRALPNAEKRHG